MRDTFLNKNIKMETSGKYVGYLSFIEGCNIVWSDNIDDIKNQWCFGMAIFESNGIDIFNLKEVFPNPPERVILLDYFAENLKLVFQTGQIIGKQIQIRKVLTEKNK